MRRFSSAISSSGNSTWNGRISVVVPTTVDITTSFRRGGLNVGRCGVGGARRAGGPPWRAPGLPGTAAVAEIEETGASVRAALALGVLGVMLAVGATASTAARARTLSIFFLRGEQLASVPRTGSGTTVAVRKLIAGPTRADVRKDFRTPTPSGTPIHPVAVTGGLATVDLGARFISGGNSDDLLARLAQLVRTTSAAGAPRLQLLIDGAKVAGIFPRVPTERPITFA